MLPAAVFNRESRHGHILVAIDYSLTDLADPDLITTWHRRFEPPESNIDILGEGPAEMICHSAQPRRAKDE